MLNVIVIPAAKIDEYNEACRNAGLATGTDKFFTIPIYQGNSQKVTHYAAYCGLGKHRTTLEKIIGKTSVENVKSQDAGSKGLSTALTKLGMDRVKPKEVTPKGNL